MPSSSPTSIHQCPECNASFKRADHLKRHVKLHSPGMQYQCVCGHTLSRSDVLSKHLRRCEKGQTSLEHLKRSSKKVTRAKTACNRCASLKLKCDSQEPCHHCNRKAVTCEYTRQGYCDPYMDYRLDQKSDPVSSRRDGSTKHQPPSTSDFQTQPIVVPSDDHLQDEPHEVSMQDTYYQQPTPATTELDSSSLALSIPHDTSSNGNAYSAVMMESDFLSNDLDFTSLFDSSYLPTQMPLFTEAFGGDMLGYADPFPIAMYDFDINMPAAFSVQQMDPVEVKCVEIRNLLQDSEPTVSKETIATFVTRQNLLLCAELFGKLFLPNVPILHMPTFRLAETPAILLLAIMLVGASYSKGIVSKGEVSKLAMRLSLIIGNEEHETSMLPPPITTIQASILLRPVLECSQNETALRFATSQYARNISMAERAGIFHCDTFDTVDWSRETLETFNWPVWVEQETRQRVACQIFVQEMGVCVFSRRSPSLSPRIFDVGLPCYESCWEADTASQCLHQLQSSAKQTTVSAAIEKISSSDSWTPLFEAPAFGMFTIVLGLHSILFMELSNDFDPCLDLKSEATNQVQRHQSEDVLSILRQDFSSDFITTMANELVSRHGSPNLKRINGMFNAWRVNWDLRKRRESKFENRTFSGDPLPFWKLAKLHMILHFYRGAIYKDNPEGEFAILEAGRGDERSKSRVQFRTVGWLLRFRKGRRERREEALESECFVNQIFDQIPGE